MDSRDFDGATLLTVRHPLNAFSNRLTRDTAPAPVGHSTDISRGMCTLLLTVIVLIGSAIRLYHLDTRSLWFDEAFSWQLTRFPWGAMLQRAAQDNNPPLYWVVLKAWSTLFGDSAFALRSLSVLMAAATIVGVHLVCVAAFPCSQSAGENPDKPGQRELGLIAAALIAVSVLQIQWAWEVRMYTMGTALAAFSTWALIRAFHSTGLSAWFVYSALALLFLYTHSYALFTVSAHVVFVIGVFLFYRTSAVPRARIARNALVSFTLVAVGWAPWLPVLHSQFQRVVADFWTTPLTFAYIEQTIQVLLLGSESLLDMPIVGHLLTAGYLVVCLLLLWRGRVGHWLLFCCAVVPIVLSLIVSIMSRNIFLARYLLFAHVFFIAAVAAMLCRVSHLTTRRLVTAWVTFIGFSIYLQTWWQLDITSRPGARAAAASIDERRAVGESVIVASPVLYYPMLFHSRDRSHWLLYDDGRQPQIHYYGSAILDMSTLITQEQVAPLDGAALWLVEMSGDVWGCRPVPVGAPWELESTSDYPEVYRFQGTIHLKKYKYRPPHDTAPAI